MFPPFTTSTCVIHFTFVETKNVNALTLPVATAPFPHRMLSARRVVITDIVVLICCLAAIWGLSIKPKNAVEKAIATVPAMPAPGDMAVVAEMPVPLAERKVSSKVLTEAIPDTTPYLTFEPDMLQAMVEQANYLRRKDVPARGASGIQKAEMQRTLELLQGINLLDPSVLLTTFDFYQVNTDLKKHQVRMTGYYTPVVKASRVQTPEYSVPMLKSPGSGIPNPAAIEAGALAGKASSWLGCALKKNSAMPNYKGIAWLNLQMESANTLALDSRYVEREALTSFLWRWIMRCLVAALFRSQLGIPLLSTCDIFRLAQHFWQNCLIWMHPANSKVIPTGFYSRRIAAAPF